MSVHLPPKRYDCVLVLIVPLYAFRMGTRPSEETLKTLKDYYSKNPKPIKEI